VRIPTKSTSDSEVKAITDSWESIHRSERSDAGMVIISEVDGLGQIRTAFVVQFSSNNSSSNVNESPGLCVSVNGPRVV